jgi:hypothetical protein
MNYKIYAPSYKRSGLCKTHKYLKQVIYVVTESERSAYDGVHENIWYVPDSAQGNLSRVRNYILDNTKESNVLLIDDDINSIGRWNGTEHKKLDEDGVYNMIQEGFQLAYDLDVRFWGINCVADKGSYREYTPFGTKQYIGGPFQAHCNNDLRYDEKIYLKEDYDMTLQVLNKYRKNLRLNMYHYDCDQATLAGGCASYRSIEREKEHNEMLVKKWGSKIITFDSGASQVNRKRQVGYDINPIIKVPIGGV